MNSFQSRLLEAISLRGITKAELSRRTGIGRNSISDYTNGKYEAKQDNVYLLAQALNVNEAWLIGLDVPMEKQSDIVSIYNQLNEQNKKETYDFAKKKLSEQNSKVSSVLPVKEDINKVFHTLAAHSSDPTHIHTEEEISELESYLDELDKKFEEKQAKWNKKHK